jgi:NADH-quinone oxidoreductase B subunit
MNSQESTLPNLPPELQATVHLSVLDQLYNWSRKRSLWPIFFGLACCAIEMIASFDPRFDLARFGMEIMRASPRQADLMIVSGTITKRMAPQVIRLYNQMPEPKYVIAMGACAISGGPFKEGYNVVSGVDKLIPVDVYVPGCPPRPEGLFNAVFALHKRMDQERIGDLRWYQKGEDRGIPVPELGPDLVDRRLTGEDIPTDYEPARLRPLRLEKVAPEREEG